MRVKFFFLLFIFLLKLNVSISQVIFSKEIQQQSYAFIMNSDSSYSVISLSGEFIKIDKFGNVIVPSFRSNLDLRVMRAIKTLDSCIILSGYHIDVSHVNRPFVAKANLNGEIQWINYANGIVDEITTTVHIAEGSFLSVINFGDTISNKRIVLIQKRDSSGILQWSEILESQFDCAIFSCSSTYDNGFICTGTDSINTFVAKFDSMGQVLWSRIISDSVSEGLQITELSDGNFIILGRNLSQVINFYLAKIDTSGNVIWYNLYSRSGNTLANKVVERLNGDLIVVGDEWVSGYGFLLNTDSNGIPLFAKRYTTDTSTPTTFMKEVFESNDKSLTLLGSGSFNSTYTADFIFKVDSLGDGVCNTISDTFLFNPVNCFSSPNIIAITSIAAVDIAISFTNSLATSTASDFCINNEVFFGGFNKLMIYPNPVQDRMVLNVPDNFNSSLIEIFNSQGQRISITNISRDDPKNEISLPNSTPSGKYYGRLISEKEVLTFSFMVVK